MIKKSYLRFSYLSFLFLFFVPKIFGYELNGELRDSSTNAPIEFASIYIDGTTIGTTSDLNGRFSLSFEAENCQIVINHVAYQREIVSFNSNRNKYLRIKLRQKVNLIPQVPVSSKNKRDKNLKYFKQEFLGEDEWGKSATIENDSVLLFRVEYYDEETSNKNLKGKMKFFEAKASQPLRVQLPRLGYVLTYDLVKFEVKNEQTKKQLSMLGYFSFKEVAQTSRHKQRSIEKNRLSAYYNSTMHFVRSLYQNKLSENGYLIYYKSKNDSTKAIEYKTVDFTSCNCLHYSSAEAYLTGLRDRQFIIRYSSDGRKPVNLETGKKANVLNQISKLYIEKDTCTIRRDGSLSNWEMTFEGKITEKRMGAALPFNVDF